jgi:hypothetical protein
MARPKVQIEVGELQDAITQLESLKLFSSPHKLYEAVAETPWARSLGATAIMVYLRVKEVNVDPDNPVITMRVKPARRVGPRDPNAQVTTRSAKVAGVTIVGLDVLIDVFQQRGIKVDDIEWLVASSQKSEAENRAIRLAWSDLRDKLGLPKPIKKSDTVASLVAESPIAAEPILGSEVVLTEEVFDVIEELPDGGFVQPQPVTEVVTVDESEAPSVLTKPGAPAEAFVLPQAVPSPMQIRPVQPRPTPVRSAVPPRAMPIPTGQ